MKRQFEKIRDAALELPIDERSLEVGEDRELTVDEFFSDERD